MGCGGGDCLPLSYSVYMLLLLLLLRCHDGNHCIPTLRY